MSIVATFAAQFGETGALRESIGKHGRAHIDRWLPFLVLHRDGDDPHSLARRVAVNSPAYVVWRAEEDEEAAAAIGSIARQLAEHSGHLLVITVEDRTIELTAKDEPRLPRFAARIGASQGAGARRAADALEKAMLATEIDLRRCKVDRVELPALPEAIEQALAGIKGVERLSFALPQIHRRGDGGVFPALTHDLTMAAGDGLLRAACAFRDDGEHAPKHYRSLGRSAYLAAALKADRKLDQIARSFDFLLSISPIDTAQARDTFLADGGEKPPRFHYRPLTIDPDSAKRELYAIDLSAMEDPLLERLLSEKRREIDAQLTMLATRNTPSFRPASMLLYGAVDTSLLDDALAILASAGRDKAGGCSVGAHEIAAAAHALVDRYRAEADGFDAKIEVREDVAGLLVSGPKLMIAADAQMPAHRLDALLAHEVSVHLLTCFNGATQGLGIFRTGLAGYEGVQEGLGVFAEWAIGGLTRKRLRLLAGRVVAVEAMLRGAAFIEVWRILNRDHGFSAGGAFGIVARVFRSGGLAKDAIYLRGFRAVIDLVAAGAPLDPFWIGKIAPQHVPAIEELLDRGLVRPPRFIPFFMTDDGARARMAHLRKGGTLEHMLNGD